MSKKTKTMPPIVRTTAGLRDALFDEIDRMRNGETNATNANAISRLSDQVVNTVYVEVEVRKHLARIPDGKSVNHMPEPLVLSA